ncbi:MAG: response regulator transcription factor [Myxococcales bacterium]|nr:response regulator transcription factor [Myxococcales bacterium]
MAKERILAVDDEEDILELIRFNVARDGYTAITATSGEKALELARREKPDLILLDVMLPGLDGLEVCKRLKSDPSLRHIPVLMLSAKGEEADIVSGLELGANDYIPKPFSPRVLMAKIRAALRGRRPTPAADGEPIFIHNLAIHPGRHEVTVDGEPVSLTFTEFRVLALLASRPGWVFSRYQIVDGVRGEAHPVTDRSVDVQIVALRKKLGAAGQYIETVRGVGYRFKE